MNRLLQRQIKSYFGKDFNIENASKDLHGFINLANEGYSEYEKEIKLLQRTIEINSEELTEANKLIQDKNLDMVAILKQYKNAIDTSLIVSKTDVNGKITYVNERFCEISGYTESELLGKNHNIVRHPDLIDAVYADLWSTIQSKQIWRGFFPNRAKNGETYYVNATIFPILNSKNEITEYMAIREDVTKNILLQKKSEYLHHRTSQIMNAQESIIVISNQQDGVIDVNQMFF
ncbi:MAG: PAS domain S-box protein, partial [Arcobacteraceae bacterium]